MWKILTTQKREKIYYSQISHRHFPESKLDGKVYLWLGLTSKRLTLWSHKAGYYTVSKCKNAQKCPKVSQEDNGNLENGIDSRR